MAQLTVNGEPMSMVGETRDLGAHLSFTLVPRPGAVRERGEAAVTAASRCGLAPLPFDARAELTAAKTGQQAADGCEVTRLSTRARQQYRTAAAWCLRTMARRPQLLA